jgi:hypothetical protein
MMQKTRKLWTLPRRMDGRSVIIVIELSHQEKDAITSRSYLPSMLYWILTDICRCKCGVVWYYLCRKKWRTCNCPRHNGGAFCNIFRAIDDQEMELRRPPRTRDKGRQGGLFGAIDAQAIFSRPPRGQDTGNQGGDIFGAINTEARLARSWPPRLPQLGGVGQARNEVGHCRHRGIWNIVPFEPHCVWCGEENVDRI